MLLTMLAGLSAHAAIQGQTGLTPDLKWPNDLLLNGKKVGGILTEMHAEPSAVRFVIVGIGINVNQEKFPSDIASLATSLRKELGKPTYRLELLVRLLTQFETDTIASCAKARHSWWNVFKTFQALPKAGVCAWIPVPSPTLQPPPGSAPMGCCW